MTATKSSFVSDTARRQGVWRSVRLIGALMSWPIVAGKSRIEEAKIGGIRRPCHLQGQVGALPRRRPPPDDSAGILHRDPPVRPLEIDDDRRRRRPSAQAEHAGKDVHFPPFEPA